MIRVLVDACLLVKGNVSNVLFDLGQAGLISLHWTPEIGAQFIKNWAARRVDDEKTRRKHASEPSLAADEAAALDAESRANAGSRLIKFELMAPEWRIPGWNAKAVAAVHSAASLGVGLRGGQGVHAGDYEVALAAIRLAEIFPDDEVWLATENIHHLPAAVMEPFDVWSIHQRDLLETLYAASPGEVQGSLEKTLADTGKKGQPKLSKADMLGSLANPQEFASSSLEADLAKAWGISLTPAMPPPAPPPVSAKKGVKSKKVDQDHDLAP